MDGDLFFFTGLDHPQMELHFLSLCPARQPSAGKKARPGGIPLPEVSRFGRPFSLCLISFAFPLMFVVVIVVGLLV